eukprot:1145154-Pelagomonas_calceolata.AAC.2
MRAHKGMRAHEGMHAHEGMRAHEGTGSSIDREPTRRRKLTGAPRKTQGAQRNGSSQGAQLKGRPIMNVCASGMPCGSMGMWNSSLATQLLLPGAKASRRGQFQPL